jgi:predicted unusual protein kinase regulating ubiquinone biosynthesis (AarF/ABC1/UbiB family)
MHIYAGQALSIRTDLITEAYALELRKLQDAVPPFDSDLAKKIICEELQIKSLDEKFKDITAVPIASASIGQVYKATLQDGRTVAVKVQRPKILNDIALDLYLLRLLSPLQTKIINPKADDVDIEIAGGFVDEWGKGLVVEVDYKLEAKNTKDFLQAMQSRGLNAVTAPTVVEELSTSRVIVTQWMDGTRLDIDASPDVPRLCGVAVNAYLTMLLDTGVLHCDPHPGSVTTLLQCL